MKIIVGLGNPGPEYENTRHNVGFAVVQHLAKDLGASGKHQAKLEAVVAEARYKGEKLILAQPTTYMNLSGNAVAKLLNWYKLGPADVVIVYDDFAIPLGQLRVRPEGSSGGHNGITSLIQCLGGPKFDRVRIGIGPLPPGWRMPDFVLGRFKPDERETLQAALSRSAEAALCVVDHGIERAMQAYNGGQPAL